ncbi:MAG: hypothetical protein GZ085_02010 [Sulfuriferula multivorans]|uniref:Uncharacterized protein n=1 Tax=Sulfuriferula multivorans TaxID=1559896 RepID=A0A7C9NYS0_9PROT|nr:hypothetical protein [Sulfuriferula multivorans]
MNTMNEVFGEVVHAYSRAQAIEDGILIDVTEAAKEALFVVPVALSLAAWTDCVKWTDKDGQRQPHQDEDWRLWDVLFMANLAVARNRLGLGWTLKFLVSRIPRGGKAWRPRLVDLVCAIGPGDSGEPVITIMLPGEN